MQAGARGEHYIEELNEAGGISAVMKELLDSGLLDGSVMTAGGITLAETVKNAKILDTEIIRPVSDPYSKTGGLVILKGQPRRRGLGCEEVCGRP